MVEQPSVSSRSSDDAQQAATTAEAAAEAWKEARDAVEPEFAEVVIQVRTSHL